MGFNKFAVAAFAVLLPVSSVWAAPAHQCELTEESVQGFAMPAVTGETYAPEVVKADLERWIEQSMATHPKFDMAVNVAELMTVKADVAAQIDRPLTELEVFRLFSRLNSVLNDGHHGIALSGRNAKITDAVAEGDRLFPLEVHIDDAYRVYVKKAHQLAATGTEIISVNGVKAEDMARYLEARSHGDSPQFRRHLVADRFTELVWQHFGTAKQFDLMLANPEGCWSAKIAGGTEIMLHRRNDPGFDTRFGLEFMESNTVAYLKLGSFYLPAGTDQWDDFIHDAFNQIKDKGAQHLIIDIRQNGGGDDTLWIEGVMPYIAGQSWQRMANFIGRVRDTDDAFPGRAGEVAVFDYQGEFGVSDKHFFDGEVYVITGALSYSSAIMFSTVIQDNGLGQIVGRETPARSCSTGMSDYHDMTVGGVVTFTPIHWYQRNDGTQSCMAGVKADIELDDDPFNDTSIVNQLIGRITKDD